MAFQYLIALSGGSGQHVITEAGADFNLVEMGTDASGDGRLDGHETFTLDRGNGLETFQNKYVFNGYEGNVASSFTVTYPDLSTQVVTGKVAWAYVKSAVDGQYYMMTRFTDPLVADAFGDALAAGGTIDVNAGGGFIGGWWINDAYGGTEVACFTAGTMIKTSTGEVNVADLKSGDLVLTVDHGYQPIRLALSRKIDAIDLAANPKLRPVRITAGSLAGKLPEKDLLVSRQHRMLVTSDIMAAHSGNRETLISAIKLAQYPGVFVDEDIQAVEYFHLVFDAHQVIYANGSPSESFYAGKKAMAALTPEAYTELVSLFPEVVADDFAQVPARTIPTNKMQNKIVLNLIAQHIGVITESGV